METKRRSLIKALSYRVIGTGVTALLVFFVTKEATLSFAVGIFDSAIKILVYFMHERAWSRIKFGRVDHPVAPEATSAKAASAPATANREDYAAVENRAMSVN